MPIDDFIAALRRNFDTFSAHPLYTQGVQALDTAYQTAIRSMAPAGYPAIYGRLLLVCHKHMVSAANLIASCLPEDSAAITRRAAEAAKVATAIYLNDANTQAWLSFDQRNERWVRRQANERPRSFQVRYEHLRGDQDSEALDNYIGVLSDAYVHFTPEFYSTLCWQVTRNEHGEGGRIYLNYFQSSTREIERHFILLMAVHGKILQAFDRCVQGNLSQQADFMGEANHLWRTARILNNDYSQRYGVAVLRAEES